MFLFLTLSLAKEILVDKDTSLVYHETLLQGEGLVFTSTSPNTVYSILRYKPGSKITFTTDDVSSDYEFSKENTFFYSEGRNSQISFPASKENAEILVAIASMSSYMCDSVWASSITQQGNQVINDSLIECLPGERCCVFAAGSMQNYKAFFEKMPKNSTFLYNIGNSISGNKTFTETSEHVVSLPQKSNANELLMMVAYPQVYGIIRDGFEIILSYDNSVSTGDNYSVIYPSKMHKLEPIYFPENNLFDFSDNKNIIIVSIIGIVALVVIIIIIACICCCCRKCKKNKAPAQSDSVYSIEKVKSKKKSKRKPRDYSDDYSSYSVSDTPPPSKPKSKKGKKRNSYSSDYSEDEPPKSKKSSKGRKGRDRDSDYSDSEAPKSKKTSKGKKPKDSSSSSVAPVTSRKDSIKKKDRISDSSDSHQTSKHKSPNNSRKGSHVTKNSPVFDADNVDTIGVVAAMDISNPQDQNNNIEFSVPDPNYFNYNSLE